MATQSDLRTRILDDLTRPANATWNTRVNNAIADAITFYAPKRFFFNFDRSFTFSTVIGQSRYTFLVADSTVTADIQYEFYTLDGVWITIGNQPEDLYRSDYVELENILESNPQTGQPYAYAYINRAMLIYPAPAAIYTVHLLGHYKAPAPANDAVTGNVWMNEGFELIRSRAKAQIAMHILEDEALASRMAIMEKSALSNLREQSAKKVAGGMIVPTQW